VISSFFITGMIIDASSNCSKFFDFDKKNPDIVPTAFPEFPRFNISILIRQKDIKFRSMNIGSGSSGTRSINELLCNEFSLTAIHWTSSCNNKRTPGYLETFFQGIRNCAAGKPQNCESWIYMNLYAKALVELLSQYEFGSDYPIAEMFPDIIHYVSQLVVLYSLRDPEAWAHSRISDHTKTPICHPRLWSNPAVLHPFDVLGCLSTGTHVYDVMMPLSDLKKKNQLNTLIEAYNMYNRFTVNYLSARQVPVLPICLWDTNHTNSDDQQQLIKEFWGRFPSTASWLNRKATPQPSKVKYRHASPGQTEWMFGEAKSMGVRWSPPPPSGSSSSRSLGTGVVVETGGEEGTAVGCLDDRSWPLLATILLILCLLKFLIAYVRKNRQTY
jgi:hypothetical protein